MAKKKNTTPTTEPIVEITPATSEHIDFEIIPLPDDTAEKSAEKENIDPLYDDVVKFVMTELKSVNLTTAEIQRRFHIGYNRASRIMEQLEKDAIVSVADKNSGFKHNILKWTISDKDAPADEHVSPFDDKYNYDDFAPGHETGGVIIIGGDSYKDSEKEEKAEPKKTKESTKKNNNRTILMLKRLSKKDAALIILTLCCGFSIGFAMSAEHRNKKAMEKYKAATAATINESRVLVAEANDAITAMESENDSLTRALNAANNKIAALEKELQKPKDNVEPDPEQNILPAGGNDAALDAYRTAFRAGKYTAAITEIRKVIADKNLMAKLTPAQKAKMYHSAALSYEKLGDSEAAKQNWRAAADHYRAGQDNVRVSVSYRKDNGINHTRATLAKKQHDAAQRANAQTTTRTRTK